MRVPSARQFTFSRVPNIDKPRSVFRCDRTYKTTFDSGYLIPIYLKEILPGDTISASITAFARLSTPVVPIMDNIYLDYFFFFVPNRLVWENWARMLGQQDNPDDSTDYIVPQVHFTSVATGSLADYFGLPVFPVSVSKELDVCAFPFRAYNLIYNEFFRDENLQDSLSVPQDDGPDNAVLYTLRRRGKRKNYITSCLPWPQKGPGVELAIGGNAQVKSNGKPIEFDVNGVTNYLMGYPTAHNTNFTPVVDGTGSLGGEGQMYHSFATYPSGGGSVTLNAHKFGAETGLYADLTGANAITINALREAYQVQRWYEQLARGGSRLQELLLTFFGVDAGDARLQRPEYLGGGEVPVQIHSVAQTSASDDITPQGNMAAYGIAGTTGRIGYSKSFVEHGYVIGLVSVRADLTWQNNVERHWRRRTKFDYYWPTFAHLGEQAVRNDEVWWSGDDDIDSATFGYQSRYDEYRYGQSLITGKLRSQVSGSLDVWHLAQAFDATPTLSAEFIEDNPPIKRALAVQDEPEFIYDSLISERCTRVMPMYGVPGWVDHF